MSSVAADKFGVVKKKPERDNVSLQQILNFIPLLKYRYRSFLPSEYVSTLHNDTFAIIKTQPKKMQGEHHIMIANSRQILFFADSLGRKKYSFQKKQYERKMPETPQSHPNVCGFCTINAAFPSH